jgi:hypothetical protein
MCASGKNYLLVSDNGTFLPGSIQCEVVFFQGNFFYFLKKYFYFFLFWHLKKSFTFNKKILTT